jgi:hypothetical protein
MTIVLMENIAPIDSRLVLKKYDLKGSLYGRETKQLNLSEKSKTLKDKDFNDLKRLGKHLIQFEDKSVVNIIETIKYDIALLRNASLMDYSFFITVAKNTGDFDMSNCLVGNRLYFSKDLQHLYFIGIIDYLTKFDKMKQVENIYKSIFNYSNRNRISAVNPIYYATRFLHFMVESVFNIKLN